MPSGRWIFMALTVTAVGVVILNFAAKQFPAVANVTGLGK